MVDQVPFWFRSNNFGSLPRDGVSSSIVGRLGVASQVIDSTRSKGLHWNGSIEVRLNTGRKTNLMLIEGYLGARFKGVSLEVGRSRSVIGLVDTNLSSGSFSYSGNALGIPKIQLALPNFVSVPILNQIISVKGNIAHGWMGTVPVFAQAEEARSYFHQKSIYFRIGRPQSRISFTGGINQQVIWGDERKIYGDSYNLSRLETIFFVATGKKYYWGPKTISKVGNQIGSIDLGVEVHLRGLSITGYRQSFYDKGALYYLANILDGLHGLALENSKESGSKARINKVLVEVLSTKNQGQAKWTPSGPEYYYNHRLYKNGYSYNGLNIGTPFITPRVFARQDLPRDPSDYFINDRVLLYHLGLDATLNKWNYLLKVSYSKNYGSYRTSDVSGNWFDGKWVPHSPIYGVFSPVSQLSAYLNASKPLPNGLLFSCQIALDSGHLLDRSSGVIFGFKKSF